ncbi:MAG: glycosyltransferase family 9 protein [Ignavibacteria bacterium]|nr:glycosyltransferase family 9 protein [Ignavibacteria bacterium]
MKSKLPHSRIEFLTKEDYYELLELNPYIDKIICINHDNLSDVRKQIKRDKYDLIFDLHKNMRSIYLSSLQNVKVLRYRKNNFKKLLLVNFKINLFKDIIPVYKKYLLVLGSLFNNIDYSFTFSNLKLFGNPALHKPYILVSPSSKHFTKTYPKEKYLEIIKKNKDSIFILTGSDSEVDMEICRYLQENSHNSLNLCGKLSFSGLADFIKYSDYVLCNDSGIMHLAEALNKNVYAFFGSTVKEFGFFPQLKSSVVFENKNLKCRPCARSGKNYCPKNHFKCMLEINQYIL